MTIATPTSQGDRSVGHSLDALGGATAFGLGGGFMGVFPIAALVHTGGASDQQLLYIAMASVAAVIASSAGTLAKEKLGMPRGWRLAGCLLFGAMIGAAALWLTIAAPQFGPMPALAAFLPATYFSARLSFLMARNHG
jgi:hypothetical protein